MKPKIDYSFASSRQIIAEICRRLADIRLARNWTQAQLAEEAGVSVKTITNLERGKNISLDTFVRVMKAFNLQANLGNLLPDATVRPLERIHSMGKERERARKIRQPEDDSAWTWGDEAEGSS